MSISICSEGDMHMQFIIKMTAYLRVLGNQLVSRLKTADVYAKNTKHVMK